jgi:hypothetical protein
MKRMSRIALRSALAILLIVILLYLGDYAFVKYRMPKNTPGDPLSTVQVQAIYTIPHKDGRAEYVFGPRETKTCVRSIFPHLGYSACWYLQRTAQQQIPM